MGYITLNNDSQTTLPTNEFTVTVECHLRTPYELRHPFPDSITYIYGFEHVLDLSTDQDPNCGYSIKRINADKFEYIFNYYEIELYLYGSEGLDLGYGDIINETVTLTIIFEGPEETEL